MTKTRSAIAAMLLLILAGSGQAQTPGPTDVRTVTGQCGKESGTASGGVKDDITANKKPFVCDSAVIAFYDHVNSHIMIQFAQKGALQTDILAFSGTMEADGQVMDVERLYLTPGHALAATNSVCKLFFNPPHLTGIFCGAEVDQGDQRSVATVAFNADPGQ